MVSHVTFSTVLMIWQLQSCARRIALIDFLLKRQLMMITLLWPCHRYV